MLQKILLLLEDRGLSRNQLERELGLPLGRFSKWESFRTEPKVSDALRIARRLGVSLDSLADDELPIERVEMAPTSERTVWRAIKLMGYEEAERRLLSTGSIAPAIATKPSLEVTEAAGKAVPKRRTARPKPKRRDGNNSA